MIKVIFDSINRANLNAMTNRFQVDYPDSSFIIDEDNNLTFIYPEKWKHVDDIDTFLCEEMCHEYNVYCYIDSEHQRSSYYHDEYDEWDILQK